MLEFEFLGFSLGALIARVLMALLVYVIGKFIIGKIVKFASTTKVLNRIDDTAKSFTLNAIRVLLMIVLIITIVGILGVPMASVITVLATAGVAVGMALQGSLSNLAGGIMLMFFRPFNVGDFISAAGADGVVKDMSLFYTTVTTTDNKDILVPNGSLMNTNVTNFTREETRRVDLEFACAKSEDTSKIEEILLDVMRKHEKVLKDPAPFARVSGGTNEATKYTVRAWCNTADYWDVYFDLNKQMIDALGAANVQAPALRVLNETK